MTARGTHWFSRCAPARDRSATIRHVACSALTLKHSHAHRAPLWLQLFGPFVVSLYSDATTRGFGGYTLPELTDIPALMNLATDASLRRDEKSLEPAFASLSASMAGRAAQVWPTPQSRLAFGCAIVHEVHVACMQTLLSPSWTPRDGTTLLWVQLPGSHERFRLPIMSYDENITASYYNPWIKACMGKYEYILNDERQDNSMVKLA